MGSPEKLDRRYLEALSGGKALSADDWWWIIETLKTRMKPLLKSISLPRLGDLRCLRDFEKSGNIAEHAIFADKPQEGKFGEFLTVDAKTLVNHLLMTQGLFYPYSTEFSRETKDYPIFDSLPVKDGVKIIWGLEKRSASFAIARISYEVVQDAEGIIHEKATEVSLDIEQTIFSLRKKLPVSELMVYQNLVAAIHQWHEQTKERFELIQTINSAVTTEKELVLFRASCEK